MDFVSNAARPRLMKVAVTGGAPKLLTEPGGNNFGISWETDGTILYGQPRDGLRPRAG